MRQKKEMGWQALKGICRLKPFKGIKTDSSSVPAEYAHPQEAAISATNTETAVTKKVIENTSMVFKLSSTICFLRLLVSTLRIRHVSDVYVSFLLQQRLRRD